MPFISTKTNKHLTKADTEALTAAYGRAIELLPGKTEAWLMLSFEGDTPMAFRGDSDTDMAFLSVSLVGKAPRAAYDALTARLCEIMADTLDIRPDMTYVKYEETEHWGYNGENF